MSPVVHVLVCIFFFFCLFVELSFCSRDLVELFIPSLEASVFICFIIRIISILGRRGAASEMRGFQFPRFYCYKFERLQTCGAQQALLSLATCSLAATTKHSHTTLRDAAGVFRSIDPTPTAEDHRILLYLLHI